MRDPYKYLKLTYLSQPRKALRFYMVLALADLVLFGFFGLHLSIASISEKYAQIKVLSEEVKSLEEKKFSIVDSVAVLKTYEPNVVQLHTRVPSDVYIDRMISELTVKAAGVGFVVSSFTPVVEGNTINVDVVFTGELANTPNLLNTLETLERYTIVSAASFDTKKGSGPINATISTFYVPIKTIDFQEPFNAKIDVEILKKDFEPAHEQL
jgi:hypothetical protein